MKTVILAAGVGSRMRPLTNTTHKSLLNVGDKPIIRRQLDVFKNLNLTDTRVVLGYFHNLMHDYLKNEVDFVYNPFYRSTNSIASLWLATMNIDDDILITNADVIFDEELIRKMISNENDINIAVSKQWNNERGYKAEVINGFVIDMGMDISQAKISGEYAGVIFVSKKMVQKLKEQCNKFLMEQQFNIWFEDLIVDLIKGGANAKAIYVNPQNWYEIDTVKELEYARNKFRK